MCMLISRLVFCGLLLIAFGGCVITKKECNRITSEAVENAIAGMYTETELEKAVNDAREGWVSNAAHTEELKAAKEKARVGWISDAAHTEKVKAAKENGIIAGKQEIKENYESMEKVRASEAAKQMIKLAEQIDFFGFDKTDATIPEVVISNLSEAEHALKKAKEKLINQPEKSVEHANKAIEIRTKIAYYFLIRYHYRLALQYKERSKTTEKLEAYGIAKQLFENANSIDPEFSLFANTSFYCAQIALDYHENRYYRPAREIYRELIKKYSSQKKPVQELIDELREKVGN